MRIFDPTLQLLERALDARLLRHNLLAGNLANADTPGFTPRDLDFAAVMRQGGGDVPAVPVPREAMTFASAGHPLDGAPALPNPDSSRDIPLSAGGSGLAGVSSTAVVAGSTAGAGLDGNAVDVDRALATVAENALQYGAAARAAGKKLAIVRYAATDGAG